MLSGLARSHRVHGWIQGLSLSLARTSIWDSILATGATHDPADEDAVMCLYMRIAGLNGVLPCRNQLVIWPCATAAISSAGSCTARRVACSPGMPMPCFQSSEEHLFHTYRSPFAFVTVLVPVFSFWLTDSQWPAAL
ncbi:hypothetical protein EJ05DRAFT_215947 [Pseudovirgaria hyperparasitica]|uniref:Uncharacterized protein n=1 Tax=Pseudovirgaria hyperparasitica TaxID=470096 RepID=A0A6A6VTI0_9PEZI|nr:uncharacterized protein EJ05DRAFT_215947 [Pseudovirgaria hyperparasitica]KAF2753455.1 hypothetical protein EJ05DRAFT_215947 [Pseudovirgaria hyperparasitica]